MGSCALIHSVHMLTLVSRSSVPSFMQQVEYQCNMTPYNVFKDSRMRYKGWLEAMHHSNLQVGAPHSTAPSPSKQPLACYASPASPVARTRVERLTIRIPTVSRRRLGVLVRFLISVNDCTGSTSLPRLSDRLCHARHDYIDQDVHGFPSRNDVRHEKHRKRTED